MMPAYNWNGTEPLRQGHIVRLAGEPDYHLVLECTDERGEMPVVLVQAIAPALAIQPQERVARHHIRKATT